MWITGESGDAIPTPSDGGQGPTRPRQMPSRSNALPIVHQIEAAGATTHRAIAAALNARGIRTARGGAWHDSTVRNLLLREVSG